MAEDQKFLGREAQVVAIGGTAKAEHRAAAVFRIEMAHQGGLEGFQQPMGGLFVDPAIVFQHRSRRSSVT